MRNVADTAFLTTALDAAGCQPVSPAVSGVFTKLNNFRVKVDEICGRKKDRDILTYKSSYWLGTKC